jgi:hypothetical protein
MEMTSDPQTFLTLTLRLAAVGVLIQSLEVLWCWRELREHGLFGWSEDGRPADPVRRIVGALWRFPGCAWMVAVRAMLAAVALLICYGSTAASWLTGGLVLAQLGYNRRFTMLAGNSETILLVALAAAWVGTLPEGSGRLQCGALLFLAAQALLAYLAAGAHKLRSRLWRSGARLAQIAQFGSYELPEIARGAIGTRRRAQLASWAVIAIELALPCAPFLPTPIFWTLLAAGFAFHTAIAVLMGLHGFWWAFAAAYPAIVFAHRLVQ